LPALGGSLLAEMKDYIRVPSSMIRT